MSQTDLLIPTVVGGRQCTITNPQKRHKELPGLFVGYVLAFIMIHCKELRACIKDSPTKPLFGMMLAEIANICLDMGKLNDRKTDVCSLFFLTQK